MSNLNVYINSVFECSDKCSSQKIYFTMPLLRRLWNADGMFHHHPPHQRLEMDRAHCRMIGFPDRSIPMAECVQRRELDRSADRRAREEALDRWMYDRPYRHWRYHP